MQQAYEDWSRRAEARSDDRDPRSVRSQRGDDPGARQAWREPRGYGPGGRPVEAFEQRLDRWVNRGLDLVDGVAGARPGTRTGGSVSAGQVGRGGSGGSFSPARLGRWVEERLDWLLDDDGEDDWREPWQDTTPTAGARGLTRPAPSPFASDRRLDGSTPPIPSPRQALQPSRSPASDGRRVGVGSSRAPSRPTLEAISRRSQASSGLSPGRSSPPAADKPGAGSASSTARPASAAPDRATPARTIPAASMSQRRGEPLSEPADRTASVDSPEEWPDDASFTLQRWQRPRRAAVPAPPVEVPPPSGSDRPLPRSTRRR